MCRELAHASDILLLQELEQRVEGAGVLDDSLVSPTFSPEVIQNAALLSNEVEAGGDGK